MLAEIVEPLTSEATVDTGPRFNVSIQVYLFDVEIQGTLLSEHVTCKKSDMKV